MKLNKYNTKKKKYKIKFAVCFEIHLTCAILNGFKLCNYLSYINSKPFCLYAYNLALIYF